MNEIAVFKVDSIWFGLDISAIREITSAGYITPVYCGAPDIAGIINLRGQIVTILDLSKKFAIPPSKKSGKQLIIIIHYVKESIGLLVDAIHDILPIKKECLEKKPSHLEGISAEYFSGVMKTPDMLIMLLDLEKVAAAETKGKNQ
ncbi:MAG TPA: chemotaxis protein CheW [Candidatus Marinimicrobia bacterium]|nr:chemotaxis protein CheW [Candidatus Neomarinimicrobiota bacterium]